jgi:hypothetical protein
MRHEKVENRDSKRELNKAGDPARARDSFNSIAVGNSFLPDSVVSLCSLVER